LDFGAEVGAAVGVEKIDGNTVAGGMDEGKLVDEEVSAEEGVMVAAAAVDAAAAVRTGGTVDATKVPDIEDRRTIFSTLAFASDPLPQHESSGAKAKRIKSLESTRNVWQKITGTKWLEVETLKLRIVSKCYQQDWEVKQK
jgi:hypothetical protein